MPCGDTEKGRACRLCGLKSRQSSNKCVLVEIEARMNKRPKIDFRRLRSVVISALVFVAGLHCTALYESNLDGRFVPSKATPAPAGTVTIGDSNYRGVNSIQETSDNGFIIGGNVTSVGIIPNSYILHGLIVRTDSKGTVLWTKTSFAIPQLRSTVSMVRQTSDGGFLVVASDDTVGPSNMSLLRTDASCNVLWEKNLVGAISYVHDCGNCGNLPKNSISAAITPDQGFIIVGTNDPSAQLNSNTWVVKLNANGDTSFVNNQIDTTRKFVGSIIESVDTGYVVASTQADTVFLMKIDNGGRVVWRTQDLPRASMDGNGINAITETSDKGLAIVGTNAPGVSDLQAAMLMKTDANGNTLWPNFYSSGCVTICGDVGNSCVATPDNAVIVLGISTANFDAKRMDVWLFKVNSGGDTLWSRRFGGVNDDQGWALGTTHDGGFILAATTDSYGSGHQDIWLIKTDANGDLVPLK